MQGDILQNPLSIVNKIHQNSRPFTNKNYAQTILIWTILGEVTLQMMLLICDV